MEETRIDRIERYLAEFIQGMKEEQTAIAELRESQKKTDEQFRKTDEQIRSFHREFMEEIRELKESQKKTDEQLAETSEQVAKTSRKVEETSKKLGELGITDGKIAEDLFWRNVRYAFRQKDIAFSDVRRNVKKKGISGEYGIVAVGENRILVVEVKKKMDEHLVDDFLERKLPKFRQIFPEYRDFPIIGGVGALVMPDSISRYAEKKGLYVLTQNGEGGAMLVNRQNFRAKEF
jgi:hypothetical protein